MRVVIILYQVMFLHHNYLGKMKMSCTDIGLHF